MDETISNSTTEESLGSDGEFSKRDVTFSRIKRKFLKHIWLARAGIIAGVLFGFYLIFLLFSTSYSQLAGDFIFAPASKVKSMDGRVNILVMGKAGSSHAGADLTDTMIFASVSLNKPKVVLVSIPRDIWIPAIRAKINSAYYYGNQKMQGGGLVLAKSTAEEVVGQPISYALVLDFNGFIKIIDEIGGIDVNIERSFIDEKYPVPGRENDLCGGDLEYKQSLKSDELYKCRYETIKFEKGVTHMGGETALKFVRSRNAQGDEGTDIAREARQSKVVAAVKQKILSPRILFSPLTLWALWREVRESTETDIPPSAGAILARRILDAKDKIESHLLPEELLIHPPISARYDNQYVFTPKADRGWSQIHEWIKNLL